MLNKIFKKIYCINLDRRDDRWQESLAEFNKIHCKVSRFSAIDGETIELPKSANLNKNEYGCLMSHYKIMEQISYQTDGEFLIFEDDVVFKQDFNVDFLKFYNQLPNDWDMVYISGNNTTPLTKVTENIYKTDGTLALHSYFIKKQTAIDLKRLIDSMETLRPIDSIFIEYQKKKNVYVFRPHLTTQRPGHSDLRGGFRNYDSVLDV